MIKTVIFDLDGLLMDTESGYFNAYVDLMAKYGKIFTLETYIERYIGGTALNNAVLMVEDYGLPISADEMFHYVVDSDQERVDKGIPAKKGARELLDYLKENGYQCVIASSSLPERARQMLKRNDMEEYFSVEVFGPDVKHSKPAPDIFLKAAEKSNTDVSECLVLEDSRLGIEASHAAGIKVICIPDLAMPDEAHKKMTEAVLEDLSQVIDYLKKQA